MRVLDAGCGSGRNVEYLLRCGAEVFGVDVDPVQVERTRGLAARLAPGIPPEHFAVASLTDLPYPDEHFDVVLCSAVLHFASNVDEFRGMVSELWRVLLPGGTFFARLASSIGIEEDIRRIEGRRYRLPDGSDRFLVDEAFLQSVSADLGARPLDPLKTTVVQGMRSMTTWVLGKDSGPAPTGQGSQAERRG
ncbi:MAG: class I SAM-dependent methyltransferase [Gemmatimonadetes bacterium]|nr:class I SAM-dependent methyltransferase [Gemmatimonadota bacterium]